MTHPNPTDLVVLSPTAQATALRIGTIMADVESLSITTSDQYQKTAELRSEMRGLAKTLETERTSQKQPFLEAGRAVDQAYSPLMANVVSATGIIDSALLDFQREQERITAEQQRIANERAEAERRRLAERAEAERKKSEDAARILREEAEAANEADKAKMLAQADRIETRAEVKADNLEMRADLVQAPVVAREVPKVAGLSTRKVWKWRFKEFGENRLPRKYTLPDTVRINRVVAALGDEHDVGDAIEVYEERGLASRTAGR